MEKRKNRLFKQNSIVIFPLCVADSGLSIEHIDHDDEDVIVGLLDNGSIKLPSRVVAAEKAHQRDTYPSPTALITSRRSSG